MSTDPPIQTRWIELLVAVCFAVAGVVVVLDSQRVGNAWGSDGPQPGYFPFYIGCLMLAGAAWVFLQTCWRWRQDGGSQVFAQAHEWRLMLKMLLPTVAATATALADVNEASPLPGYLTRPINYLGLCALSVPAGLAAGLPYVCH